MAKYKYETHLHTYPVSACARQSVRENLEFYKSRGYDGIFITNHFIDGNINVDRDKSYEEKIEFYFSDYEEAKKLSEEIGIKVFLGIELSYGGTDFLLYGLDKEWFLKNPQITEMKKSDELKYFMENGGLVIQAHPYREAAYIDHIRLFPRCVHGVEVINANRTELENKMADIYAENYGLIKFAGSDNHAGNAQMNFAGMESDTPINSEDEFIEAVKNGTVTPFSFSITE
ncbi:MAG: PHP domain-containing protein [Clostridia bacterium]|nr:PHP domain-containing protein [Clostridia bacterium]